MKTSLKTLITSCAIILCLAVQGQDSLPKKTKLYGGFGHFSFSGEQIGVNGLNNTLAANGFDKLSTVVPSFGGGGAFCIKNLILGGGGAWLVGTGVQNAGRSVSLKGGYGYFSAGYVLISTKRLVLYPTLGIGGGGYSLIISKTNSTQDFSQQLSSPQDMVTADAGGWMTNLQLSCQYFFNKKETQGWFIGLKAGYKYSPNGWKISVNNSQLSGAPTINMNGFYASLILGGGSLTKD